MPSPTPRPSMRMCKKKTMEEVQEEEDFEGLPLEDGEGSFPHLEVVVGEEASLVVEEGEADEIGEQWGIVNFWSVNLNAVFLPSRAALRWCPYYHCWAGKANSCVSPEADGCPTVAKLSKTILSAF